MNYDLNFLVWVAMASSSYLNEFLDCREEMHLGN